MGLMRGIAYALYCQVASCMSQAQPTCDGSHVAEALHQFEPTDKTAYASTHSQDGLKQGDTPSVNQSAFSN